MKEAQRPETLYITRRVAFCASHRYENRAWSEEKNREVFGPCYNPYGHGHNYELEVTICGGLDPETGMVLNLRHVDAILHEEVVARFDHRFINKEVEGFEGTNPTVENICLKIWDLIQPRFDALGCRVHRVRLHESSGLYGEYLGEEDGSS